MDKILNDDLLRDALAIYEEKWLDSVEESDIVPSKKFEKKMERLIRSQSNLYYRMTYTRARKAVAIAAAVSILLVSMLSVGAVREAIFNFFVSRSADYSYMEYNTENITSPGTLETFYSPSFIPEGYELTDSGRDSESAFMLYTKGEDYLKFEQFTKTSYRGIADSEFSEIKTVARKGTNYILRRDSEGAFLAVFERDGYVFELLGFLGEDEMLSIADSVAAVKGE